MFKVYLFGFGNSYFDLGVLNEVEFKKFFVGLLEEVLRGSRSSEDKISLDGKG